MEESSSLSSYLNKSQEINYNILDERKDNVLLFICRSGVTFPTEIARECDLDVESVNKILYLHKRNSFITKMQPDKNNPQTQFRGRMTELWACGLWGFERFITHSWWTLTLPGFHFIKAKYPNKNVRIKGSLIKALELEYN